MNNKTLKIAVMIGSIRKDRASHHPAEYIAKILENRGAEVLLIDLKALDLPLFDDETSSEGVEQLLAMYREMDGIMIVNPEYNHGISSAVKNAIDFARNKELFDKPMSLVTTSRGRYGGVRSTQMVQSCWQGAGGLALNVLLPTSQVRDMAQEIPDYWKEAAEQFVDRSLKWFHLIQEGMNSED